MALKRIALATLLAFTTALMAPAASLAAAAPAPTNTITVPVTGSGGGNTFAGTFQLQKFVADNGQVSAVGLLSGTVTTAAGVVTSIVKTVSLPVAVAESTCDILHLDLGPLSLNLLGLQIDLSRVVLDITAQAGAGNLLGNLLCGVANLLNDPSGLAKILNSILALLQ
jgi:hypothetical protein